MRFLAYLVLLSAIVISACGAYFSIVGLKLLFVGGGMSIIVMGTALEVGKLITATFLKQKWNDISLWMKTYMVIATFFLMLITSIGIYGYLSAGYTATSIAVQGYEHQIESNISKIADIEKEISASKSSTYNESEIRSVEENRKKVIEQRTQLIDQKNKQIETIRKSSDTNKDASADINSAKQALELSKSSTDSDIGRELEQIKLYNSRLEILDREVQKWMDEGNGGLFKKSGLEKARTVKDGQSKERVDIDVQIKASQDRIEKLRQQYMAQVKEYNDRVLAIESRNKSQRGEIDTSIKNLEKEISDTTVSIIEYNKETDNKISSLNSKKDELSNQTKKNISDQQNIIQSIRSQNVELQEKIIHTDVGTFKFIANSLNIPLDKAVNYFIWSIMAVFDPLAISLILAFNVLIAKKDPPTISPSGVLVTPIPTPTPTVTLTDTIIQFPTLTPESEITLTPVDSPTPTPTLTVTSTPTPTEDLVEISIESVANDVSSLLPNIPVPPKPPVAPHGITSGKVSPR